MLESLKKTLETRMGKAVQVLQGELNSVRTGRATSNLLEHIRVEAYGGFVPISQVANVNVQDSKTLTVQVWDKDVVKSVEKAINTSDLGLNSFAEGQVIRVPIPPLSEERRKDMVKMMAKYAEQNRVAVRNIRRDGIDEVKKLEKDGKISKDDMHKCTDEIQKLTDKSIKEIDILLSNREKEVMQV